MYIIRGRKYTRQFLLVFGFFIYFMLFAFYVHAAQKSAQKETSNLHAQPWAFGQSEDRNALIWKKGVDGAAFNKKSFSDKLVSPDKTSNIEQSISNANKNSPRGNFNLSMQKESTSWIVSPEQKSSRPDEDKIREQRHVLGAYAGVQSGDDFNISIGPELILKDENHSNESANSDQPDSAIGMGMKFKYGF